MSKHKRPPFTPRMPDDTVAFGNANDLLEEMGVRYKRTSMHQLKIGRINYFPNTGSIVIDGESKARTKRGKGALKALLLEERRKLNVFVAKREAEAARICKREGEDDVSL